MNYIKKIQGVLLSFLVLYTLMLIIPVKICADSMYLEKKEKIVDQKQIQCAATAIYYEGRNEPIVGKLAIARVIQNRIRRHFAPSECGVVLQRSHGVCQFNFTCQKYGWIKPTQCLDCWHAAKQVLVENRHQNLAQGFLYFRAGSSSKSKYETLIGNQLFRGKT